MRWVVVLHGRSSPLSLSVLTWFWKNLKTDVPSDVPAIAPPPFRRGEVGWRRLARRGKAVIRARDNSFWAVDAGGVSATYHPVRIIMISNMFLPGRHRTTPVQ